MCYFLKVTKVAVSKQKMSFLHLATQIECDKVSFSFHACQVPWETLMALTSPLNIFAWNPLMMPRFFP